MIYVIIGCESDPPLAQYSQLYSPRASSQSTVTDRGVTISGGSQGALSCRSSIADSDSEMECSTISSDKQVRDLISVYSLQNIPGHKEHGNQ